MLVAIIKYKNGTYKEIKAMDLKDNPSLIKTDDEIFCPCCLAPAAIKKYHNKIWHFAATHKEDCINVSDGREHPVVKVNEHTVIALQDMLNHEDTRITIKPTPPTSGDDGTDLNIETNEVDNSKEMKPNNNENQVPTPEIQKIIEKLDDDDLSEEELNELAQFDSIANYVVRTIKSVKALYNYLVKTTFDQDVGLGLTGKELYLSESSIKPARKGEKISGIKMLLATRVKTKDLQHPIKIEDGYTLLRDAYAKDVENSIFVMVKFSHREHNDNFRREIMGVKNDMENTFNKNQHILILGDFVKEKNDFYEVYKVEVNSRTCKFITVKEYAKDYNRLSE